MFNWSNCDKDLTVKPKFPLYRSGESFVNERRFRKLKVSVNERQKQLIFKTLTERISRLKKIKGYKRKLNCFFKR